MKLPPQVMELTLTTDISIAIPLHRRNLSNDFGKDVIRCKLCGGIFTRLCHFTADTHACWRGLRQNKAIVARNK